jgi:adenosylmethionine-8-amino-7-oxononanoate aminotransferase
MSVTDRGATLMLGEDPDPLLGFTPAELVDLAKRHTWYPNGHEQAEWEEPGRIVASQFPGGYTDIHGNSYVESYSAFAGGTLGRGNLEIVSAVVSELQRNALVLSGSGGSPAQVLLAKAIADRTPGRLNRALFGLGGSDVNEMAFKIARQYWAASGRAGKYKIVSQWGSYHGGHLATTAASGYTNRRVPYEPLPAGFLLADPPYYYDRDATINAREATDHAIDGLRRLIEREGPSTIAAWIGDLVITALGPYPVPEDYPRRVRELCDEFGILMIVDEVITGWGRVGAWTASELYGVEPDMLSLAKGITGLYQPLGALVVRDEIAQLFNGANRFEHVLTSAGYAPGCAAALATIRYIEEHGVIRRVVEKQPWLRQRLEAIQNAYRCVGRVYSIGLHAGIDLIREESGSRPIRFSEPDIVARHIRDVGMAHGVILQTTGRQLAIAPALIASDAEWTYIMAAVEAALASVDRTFCGGGN